MRHGTANRRPRNRNNNGGGNGNGGSGRRGSQTRMKVYDSNGPDVRIRGTAHQVTEKYSALAKDALVGGNFVLAESYSQHAEHYQRLINAMAEESAQNRTNNSNKDTYAGNNGQQEAPSAPVQGENDLSLPASILGSDPNPEPEAAKEERTGAVVETSVGQTVDPVE